jgi:hypothetical protein
MDVAQRRGTEIGMVFLDGTNIRARQNAAGIAKKGKRAHNPDVWMALDRSRGGPQSESAQFLPVRRKATQRQEPLECATRESSNSCRGLCPPQAGEGAYTRIQVSEKASIAVVIECPATSRGVGFPGSVLPLTSIVASRQPTKRLGM